MYALIWSSEHAIYQLYEQGNDNHPLLLGDTTAWFVWLSTHNAFSFQGKGGHLNLLKEARKNKGEGYWYAYQRQGNRTVKHYVGRSVDLSMAHLEAIAGAIADLKREPSLPPMHPPGADMLSSTSSEEQAQLLEPKLRPPRLHTSLVKRERLFALLDTGQEHKLTLLSAPAGFGKTTLVSQWIAERTARQQQFSVAWVALDTGDNDPVRFWRYVITACQTLQAGLGKAPLMRLSTQAQSPFKASPLEPAIITFLNVLNHLPGRGTLVLEDYHVITEPQIHETMSFFLDHLPPTLHVVMLSRSEPALPLARLRASGDLREIHAPDLRFSTQETRDFLRQSLAFQASTIAPTHKVIRQLENRLEGWAAGLRLFVLLLQGSANKDDIERVLATLAGSQRSVQDYFVGEVLGSQPESLQRFLLQTSILSRLNGSLCDAITGREDSDILLDALERAGLFLELLEEPGPASTSGTQLSQSGNSILPQRMTCDPRSPRPTSRRWYRYHALFAEAMRAEAHHRLGGSVLSSLSSEASQWYEQHGMLAEAIEAALKAEDMVRAAELMEQSIEKQLFNRMYEAHTHCRWLEQIPAIVMRQHPALCLSYATALAWSSGPDRPTTATLTQIEELLQLAEEGWQLIGNTTMLGEVYAFRAIIALQQGKLEEALADARQALTWLPAQETMWRSMCLNTLGTGELRSGKLTLARKTLLETLALWEAAGHLHARRSCALQLGAVCFGQGELHIAVEYYRQVHSEAREVGDRDDSSLALLGRAEVSYEWNELEEASRAAQEAYTLGEQTQSEELQVQAMLVLVRVLYAQGQISLAQQRLAALLTRVLPHREPLLYREVLLCQARILLALEDLSAAQRCLRTLARQDEIRPPQIVDATTSKGSDNGDVADQHNRDLPPDIHEREVLITTRLLLVESRVEEPAQMGTDPTERAVTDRTLEKLMSLLSAAREDGRTRSMLEIQVVLALALVARKQLPEARQQLHAVLSFAHTEGYLRLFLDEGETMYNLLRTILLGIREKSLATYVRAILHAFDEQRPVLSSSLSRTPSPLSEPLSPQEGRVLRLLVAEHSYTEIASEMIVSINTIKTQVQSIYRKLNVSNRRQAREAARNWNLL